MEDGHSYGPTCRLHEQKHSSAEDGESAPPLRAQFFYISNLLLDDPLAPLPPITVNKKANHNPLPFSTRDNSALDEAWLGLRQPAEPFVARPGSRGLHRMFSFPKFKSGQVVQPEPDLASPEGEFVRTISEAHKLPFGTTSPRKIVQREADNTLRRPRPNVTRKESGDDVTGSPDARSNKTSDASRRPSETTQIYGTGIFRSSDHEKEHLTDGKTDLAVSSLRNSSISGRPFVRVPSSRTTPLLSKHETASDHVKLSDAASNNAGQPEVALRKASVSVGAARLYNVELSELRMSPIYWKPVNDVFPVIRATWFYKDTMLPLPAELANQLELGYEDVKPYASTYKHELDACVEFGPLAELKVFRRLWPKKSTENHSTSVSALLTSEDELIKKAMTDSSLQRPENSAVDLRREDSKASAYKDWWVVYTNQKSAQILEANVLPSARRGRAPLASIRNGQRFGVAVVRGFDAKVWQRSQQQKTRPLLENMPKPNHKDTIPCPCPVCASDNDATKVTDLVLVVHGIGQKLSERVDSYHFTHAINGLRREINVDLANSDVNTSLRKGASIMTLPINWRLTLNLEENARTATTGNQYELKDIVPETLPAVRSIISDVMLDIPYYMSHHKPKMIAAVIKEANRVFRLWHKNNPGFASGGRVHLIAHSLGSVMAMDILSRQPTLTEELDLSSPVKDDVLEFGTTNLFCCGSPAGFFLLLNNTNLVPRKSLTESNADKNDTVTCSEPKYGCLAVDNIYNIIHKNDPVAYQQNACVDGAYANLLEQALIPAATQTFLSRLTGSLRLTSMPAQNTKDAYGYSAVSVRPSIAQMPSTVELEVHNFTKEEIAEKRMSLLNENGQIDYFLESGGGPLEIQYLNMLSAHSSYWYLPDFVRFLVIEIGRKPGKEHTLPVLRAKKKRKYKRGESA